jgi:hypothetical protein
MSIFYILQNVFRRISPFFTKKSLFIYEKMTQRCQFVSFFVEKSKKVSRLRGILAHFTKYEFGKWTKSMDVSYYSVLFFVCQ